MGERLAILEKENKEEWDRIQEEKADMEIKKAAVAAKMEAAMADQKKAAKNNSKDAKKEKEKKEQAEREKRQARMRRRAGGVAGGKRKIEVKKVVEGKESR